MAKTAEQLHRELSLATGFLSDQPGVREGRASAARKEAQHFFHDCLNWLWGALLAWGALFAALALLSATPRAGWLATGTFCALVSARAALSAARRGRQAWRSFAISGRLRDKGYGWAEWHWAQTLDWALEWPALRLYSLFPPREEAETTPLFSGEDMMTLLKVACAVRDQFEPGRSRLDAWLFPAKRAPMRPGRSIASACAAGLGSLLFAWGAWSAL